MMKAVHKSPRPKHLVASPKPLEFSNVGLMACISLDDSQTDENIHKMRQFKRY